MAGLTMTAADAVLKEDYLPGVREQVNNDTFTVFFEKDTDSIDVTGRRALIAAHVLRNAGIGSRLEAGQLPAPQAQGYADEYVNLRYHYGSIQVTGQTIRAMASNATSYIRAVKGEMDGVTNDLRRDFGRQIFGTSDGVIAKTGTTTASATVQLANAAYPNGTSQVQVRQFEVGMFVDIGTVANPTLIASNQKISAVDTTNLTITIPTAVTTTTSHRVFRQGNGGASGGVGQSELTGFQTVIASSGAYFNIDPATYPIWACYTDGNSGTLRSITEVMIAKAAQQTRIKAGTDIDTWVVSDGVDRAYANLLLSLKRYPGPEATTLRGGYSMLPISAAGVRNQSMTWDRDSPANTAFGLNTSHWAEYQASDWDWMQEDGNVLQRLLTSDAYQATLFKYAEIGTDKRNAHCIITDLTEA